MKNEISKEKRLETYKKALEMYTTGVYPDTWMKDYEPNERLDFGLCQVLRTICMEKDSLSTTHFWPNHTKWIFDDTSKYFPEFANHWNRRNLNNEERIQVLK